ncbi:MAG: LptF/LptG family permease [Alphaproteobacteria bacterium]|nr:MAG: LptF/LptG family permease [Alphaproteobacteria bacterium]
MVLGVILSGVGFYLGGVVQPKSEYRFQKLGHSVQQRVLGTRLQAGRFVTLPDRAVLRFSAIDATGHQGTGLFFASCNAGPCQYFSARRGALLADERRGYARLVLDDGQGLVEQPQETAPLAFDFSRVTLPLILPEISAFRPRPALGNEATTAEIWSALQKHGALTAERRADYRARLVSRLVQALVLPFLPLLAFALGIANRRRRAYAGAAIGLLILVGYVEAVQLATSLAAHAVIAAEWIALPFAGFTGAAVFLYRRSVHEPGIPRLSQGRGRLWHAWDHLRGGTERLMTTGRWGRHPLLGGYIASRLVLFVLATLVLLLALVLLVDILTHARDILAAEGARWVDLLRYAWLRWPEQLTRFLPLATLLGTLLTLISLSQTHELTVMAAAGASPWRLLVPFLAVGGMIAMAGLVVSNTLAPHANAQLAVWKANGYGPGGGWLKVRERRDVWLSADGLIAHAGRAHQTGKLVFLEDALFLRQDPRGRITELRRAASAIGIGGEWFLASAAGIQFDTARGPQPTESDQIETPPLDFLAFPRDADTLSLAELYRYAPDTAGIRNGKPAVAFEILRRVAGPAMALLMTAVAFTFGGTGSRNGRQIARMARALSYGFIIVILQSFLQALGVAGTLPPTIANLALLVIGAIWIGYRILISTVEA